MKSMNCTRMTLAHAATMFAGFALSTTPANAELILLEQFDYATGPLNDDDGGLGFDGGWVNTGWSRDYEVGIINYANGAGTTINELGGLEFPGLETAGGAISRFGTAGQRVVTRNLSAESQTALTADGTTIWFSVLTTAPSNGNKFGTIIFGTDALMTQQSAPPFPNGNLSVASGQAFGITMRNTSNGGGTGSPNAIAFINSDAPTVNEGTYLPPITEGGTHHDTSLVVGRIKWNPNGTEDELLLFNITDASGPEPAEEEAIATLTADFDQSNLDVISLWDTGSTIYDEIRFGTNFVDVVGAQASGPLTLNIAPSGPGFSLSWNSQDGQAYDLVSSTDLSTPPAEWPAYEGNANIVGVAPENTLVIPEPTDQKRFFAIIAKGPVPPPLLEEDFESVTPLTLPTDWSGTDNGAGTVWQVGSPSGAVTGPETAANGLQCAGTNIGANYTNPAQASLVTKAFTVPAGGATLNFSQYIDTEVTPSGDLGAIRLLNAGDNSVLTGGDLATNLEGNLQQWTNQSIALPTVANGLSVKIEFFFESDEDAELASGFYIDDIEVLATAP